MNPQIYKANIGLALVITVLITLISGIVLHLKKHGILVEPRNLIKIVHFFAGILMLIFAWLHGAQFWKWYVNLRRSKWFKIDTTILIVLIIATGLTGLIKMLSPIRIPHLGLWHYWLGLAMSISAAIHLIKGVPGWWRLIKDSKK